jgi:hypothetical protein
MAESKLYETIDKRRIILLASIRASIRVRGLPWPQPHGCLSGCRRATASAFGCSLARTSPITEAEHQTCHKTFHHEALLWAALILTQTGDFVMNMGELLHVLEGGLERMRRRNGFSWMHGRLKIPRRPDVYLSKQRKAAAA